MLRLTLCLLSILLLAVPAQAQNIRIVAGGGPLNSFAPAANIGHPNAIAVDDLGNLIIAAPDLFRILKVDAAGNLTIVAGGGLGPEAEDGVLAVGACIGAPTGVSVDGSDHIYFAYGNRIRKVDAATGLLSTVAGPWRIGPSSGDNGPSSAATLSPVYPWTAAVDATGNIYIPDTANHRIRRVDGATGIITTVAGTGVAGYSGDNGPATSAALDSPAQVMVDHSNNVYFYQRFSVANLSRSAVRRIDATSGSISTVTTWPFPLGGLAMNSQGFLYFSDDGGCGLSKVSPSGQVTAVTRSVCGFAGDGGSAINAMVRGGPNKMNLAIDWADNIIFIADSGNHRVRRVNAQGIIDTVAGGGSGGDGGLGVNAVLTNPVAVAVDSGGNPYIVDDDRIRNLDVSGTIVTVAGNTTSGFSGDGVAATSTSLKIPFGMALDPAGNILIADTSNSRIRRVDSVTRIITTFAGGGIQILDGVPATSARLMFPYGVAADPAGNVFVADNFQHRVYKVNAAGLISTVAGNGTAGSGGDGGPATGANLNIPSAVAVDAFGNIYIADYNRRIRRVDGFTGIITTIAGLSSTGFGGDGGLAVDARLAYPRGLALDAAGNLFIADSLNFRIRRVDALTGTIYTVAGGGLGGIIPHDGEPATGVTMGQLNGVAIDASNNLYIADSGLNLVYRVHLVPILSPGLPGIHGFRCQKVGVTSAPQTMTITNTGGDSLRVAMQSTNSDFNVASTCGPTLPPGQQCAVSVTFTPSTAGEISGRIIFGYDADNISYSWPVTGSADTTPPVMATVSASPDTLWPPDHKMVDIALTASATDNCDPAPAVKIISVASNEPINGLGDGDTAPDWEVTGNLTLRLRAERSGTGNGRIYTITVQATDAAGTNSTKSVTVTVPKDKRK